MADGSHNQRASPRLSKREIEVLALVAAGLADPQIAERLCLSPRTVSHHVSAICAKLGARRRTDAVTRAIARGLLPLRGNETPP